MGACLLGTAGCQSMTLASEPPVVCLGCSAKRLVSYFDTYGWAWDDDLGRWLGPPYGMGEMRGETSLLLWGPYDKVGGHWVDIDRLLAGVAPQAAALEIGFALEDKAIDSAYIAQTLHERYGIKDSAILSRCSISVTSQTDSPLMPFYEVCSYATSGIPMIWWLTMNGLGGVVVGCARLDYYATRKRLQPTYEAVGTMTGPWDLDIRRFI